MITAGERARAESLLARLRAAGAHPVEAALLQPAGTLLDLYGEDIRARAFTTQDPAAGEMMLRPDFTVPVVQAHMAEGAEPARYAYMGEVFRRQEEDPTRAREYLQVGFEVFDGARPADADAEVFALISDLLAPWAPVPATGDLGILIAAVEGLTTSDRRRAALRRHIWRPGRFKRLMDRYTGQSEPLPGRAALLDHVRSEGAMSVIDQAGPSVGLRTPADVATRLAALAADAEEPAITRAEAEVIDTLLTMDGTMTEALSPLRDLAVDLPALSPAADRLEARAEAMARRGLTPETLPFAPARGRTAMEYYDGFVFTLSARGRSGQAPVATGGRYDALTSVLGQGRSIPAVGGVIRPGLLEDTP
ncbi:ATP phosphoribosyltransferase regulatory subunit [Jannaschia pagri]|uniref:Histidine--tRNA ligase n=1 Tax=Jannaschia pagri TaxID=2829797 RepID=A0ABQ4NQK5_9RHOB|nr:MULTISPECIES: ATP phosphoribosyltransferase regulatory subunit [unclassified Jannaschia]GIT92860.1 ATP phosphoribosyltransferase regulatory subunit [Jannaschia sp. AI_61]GIT96695.1 ATP phosphoribosyltransferase regulatory subunit [Jannaschia sp. AI_62]